MVNSEIITNLILKKSEKINDLYPRSGTLGGFHDSDTHTVQHKLRRTIKDFDTISIKHTFNTADIIKLKSFIPLVHASHANCYGRGYVAFLRKAVVSSRPANT